MLKRIFAAAFAGALAFGVAQAPAAQAAPAPTLQTGGVGNFYKSATCSPNYAGQTTARMTVTNYDKSTGQEYHYSMKGGQMTGIWWNPVAIYVNGVKWGNPYEGYLYYANRGYKVTFKGVWGWGPYKKSCTIYNF